MTDNNRNQILHDLVDRHLHGELSEPEQEQLASLLDSSPEARQEFVESVRSETELSGFLRVNLQKSSATEQTYVRQTRRAVTSTGVPLLRSLLVLALVVIVGLTATLIHERSGRQDETAVKNESDASIARITGLSGALIWTGDRGQIVRDVKVGTKLAGGTIEGMAPDSWFELQFNDGSNVIISGASVLTFADSGQKILRLREGRLSAEVQPQPQGKPMLVHTRTALLSVLGTRFDVEAELASTALNVSEGRVRIRRLSDGREVDVPAEHLVVADDERELTPERVSQVVNEWKTDFQRKPDNYGKWQTASKGRPASVKAIPLVPPDAPHVTLHLAGISVDRSDGSRVLIEPGSRFVVRGRLHHDAPVFFGIRVAHPNGEFAGMFRGDFYKKQPPAQRSVADDFEQVYDLKDFTVDPAVWDKKDNLAPRPDGLVLTGVWAFTHTESPAGLEITEVELLPPEAGR